MTTDTVEWGSEHGRSEHGRPEGKRRLMAASRRHTLAVAGGAAVLGFALTLTAEVLPWLKVKPTGAAPVRAEVPSEIDNSLQLAQLVVWQAPAYYLGITALLALTALALLGRARIRRGAAAAAVGTAAGQAVLLVAVLNSVREGNEFTGMLRQLRNSFEISTGEGFYSAAAGLVLIGGAAALAGWWGGAWPARPAAAEAGAAEPGAAEHGEDEPDAGPGGPLDLSVTPAAPFHGRA
jgi:hypothetical protein